MEIINNRCLSVIFSILYNFNSTQWLENTLVKLTISYCYAIRLYIIFTLQQIFKKLLILHALNILFLIVLKFIICKYKNQNKIYDNIFAHEFFNISN